MGRKWKDIREAYYEEGVYRRRKRFSVFLPEDIYNMLLEESRKKKERMSLIVYKALKKYFETRS